MTVESVATAKAKNIGINLFVPFAIFGILLIGYIQTKSFLKPSNSASSEITIAFKAQTPVANFDPAFIKMDTEYIVLENLFSTLLILDNQGLLRAGVADQLWLQGYSLHLKIQDN